MRDSSGSVGGSEPKGTFTYLGEIVREGGNYAPGYLGVIGGWPSGLGDPETVLVQFNAKAGSLSLMFRPSRATAAVPASCSGNFIESHRERSGASGESGGFSAVRSVSRLWQTVTGALVIWTGSTRRHCNFCLGNPDESTFQQWTLFQPSSQVTSSNEMTQLKNAQTNPKGSNGPNQLLQPTAMPPGSRSVGESRLWHGHG